MTLESITARSADGTRVAARRLGSGPPLLVVHGIAADAGRFATRAPPRLDERFTVFAVDRRGRGASGDSDAYALAREVEDVVALLDAVAEATGVPRIAVLGHSFGGLVALEALLCTKRIRRLVVYEPYAPEVAAPSPSPLTLEYVAMATSGDPETLVTKFLREIIRMSPADFDRLRAHDSWPSRVALAHTIPREMAAAETYAFAPARFASNEVPIRMLRGERSPPFLRDATTRLHAGLPQSEIVELAGQEHVAMDTAPALFLDAVTSFLA